MTLDLDRSTWERVRFGDVIANVTERVDDPSSAGVDRYVGLEHLDPGVLTVQRWDSPDKVEAQKLRFYPGDVIFGRRRAYQKKVALAEFEGICSAHALVLRAKPGRIHPDFLPHFLASDYFLDRAIAISVGSLSPTVNWRDLQVQEFDLPPLPEQQRLAALLWAVERHRQSLTTGANKLRISQQTLLDLHSFGAHRWPLKPFDSIIDFKEGPGIMAVDFHQDGVPLIRIAGMTSETSLLDGCNYLDPEKVEIKWSQFRLDEGDVLLSTSATLGQVAIVGKEAVGAIPYTGLIRMRPASDSVLPELIPWLLRTSSFMEQIKSAGVGSVMAHFGPSHLRKMRLPLPDIESQKVILRTMADFTAHSDSLSAEGIGLGVMRNGVLSTIFGGAQ